MMHRHLHRLIYVLRMMSWIVDPRFYSPQPQYPIRKPVFLLGTQGGGLTLLARMLQRHPDVITAAGNSDYWTSANELQNVFGPALPFELTGLRYKAPPHKLLTAPRSWTFATDELLPAYRKTEQDATPYVAERLKNVIRYCAQRFARDKDSCRFVDKSQVFCLRVGMLHQILPDAYFVLVPRDPYISAYRAAMGKAADMKRLIGTLTFEERIRLCAEHYGNSMRAVFDDTARLNIPLHVLPFERLLREPETSLQEVCAFAELAYSPDMLPAAGHVLPPGSRFLDRWHPIRAEVNAEYEDKIDARVIRIVNECAGDVVEKLGYKLRHPEGAG